MLADSEFEGIRLGSRDEGVWHLIDRTSSLTSCGLTAEYGSRRVPWSDTADEERCLGCVDYAQD